MITLRELLVLFVAIYMTTADEYGYHPPEKQRHIKLNFGIHVPPIVLKMPKMQMPQVTIKANFLKKPNAKPLEVNLPPPPQISFGEPEKDYGGGYGGGHGGGGGGHGGGGYGGGDGGYGGHSVSGGYSSDPYHEKSEATLHKSVKIEKENEYGPGESYGGSTSYGSYGPPPSAPYGPPPPYSSPKGDYGPPPPYASPKGDYAGPAYPPKGDYAAPPPHAYGPPPVPYGPPPPPGYGHAHPPPPPYYGNHHRIGLAKPNQNSDAPVKGPSNDRPSQPHQSDAAPSSYQGYGQGPHSVEYVPSPQPNSYGVPPPPHQYFASAPVNYEPLPYEGPLDYVNPSAISYAGPSPNSQGNPSAVGYDNPPEHYGINY